MLIYNGVFVFYFCFSSFFLLFLSLLPRPYCFFLLLNLITSFYCRAATNWVHKYKWKLRSVPLKISAYFFFIAVSPVDFAADLWYNKMGFKNIAFLKMVFFNKWKLRTISLKNSVYFFLLQPAILTLQLIYDIIKWGLFFFKKKFFVAHSFTSSICLTKLCQDGYSS